MNLTASQDASQIKNVFLGQLFGERKMKAKEVLSQVEVLKRDCTTCGASEQRWFKMRL